MAERKINGAEYRFEKLPAFEGLELAGRVLKILGPAWGYLDRLFDEDEATRDAQSLAVMGAIVQNMNVGEVVDLLKELCNKCEIRLANEYVPINAEQDIKSELDVLKVAMFVLEIQAKDFFVGEPGSRLRAMGLRSPRDLSNDSPQT